MVLTHKVHCREYLMLIRGLGVLDARQKAL